MKEANFRIANLEKWKSYKKIKTAHEIIIHDTGVRPEQTPEIVDQYHKDKGFTNGLGYDIYINDNGIYETRRLYNNLLGAHTKGHNLYSLGICITGLEMSLNEKNSLKQVLNMLFAINPKLRIKYHKELSAIRRDPFQDVVNFIEENYSEYRGNK